MQRSNVFFSQLKLVTTDLRTALSLSSLNTVLRIKLRTTSITEFHEKLSDNIVDLVTRKTEGFIKVNGNSTIKQQLKKGLVSHLT